MTTRKDTMTTRATAAKGRSGGKVDAPGKTHRKAPAALHGIKHSDETIPKLKAAQTMRRGRRG
jgi:hypothetical protein